MTDAPKATAPPPLSANFLFPSPSQPPPPPPPYCPLFPIRLSRKKGGVIAAVFEGG